jgi:hypothetical protein
VTETLIVALIFFLLFRRMPPGVSLAGALVEAGAKANGMPAMPVPLPAGVAQELTGGGPAPPQITRDAFAFGTGSFRCGVSATCFQDSSGLIHYALDCDPNSPGNFGRTLPLACREPNLRRLLEA